MSSKVTTYQENYNENYVVIHFQCPWLKLQCLTMFAMQNVQQPGPPQPVEVDFE